MATNPIRKRFMFSIRDFYKDYVKSVTLHNKGLGKNQEKLRKLEYIRYRDFINDVFSEIFKLILEESWHFVMPYSLGEFYLKEVKHPSGQSYSRALSVQAGKPVFVRNDHTLRKTYKFVWDRTYALFPTAQFYKFEILRGKNKIHKKYNVGREAISKYLFSIGKDPSKRIPVSNLEALGTPQDPPYEFN